MVKVRIAIVGFILAALQFIFSGWELAAWILLIGVGIPLVVGYDDWRQHRATRARLLRDCHDQHAAWRREDDMTAVFGRYRPAIFHQPEFTDMAATVRHDALRELTAFTLGRTVDELDQLPKPPPPAPEPETSGIFDMLDQVSTVIDAMVSGLTVRSSAADYRAAAEEAIRIHDQIENQQAAALRRAQARVAELEREKRELQARNRRAWDTVADVSRLGRQEANEMDQLMTFGQEEPIAAFPPGRGEGWPWPTTPYPSTYRPEPPPTRDGIEFGTRRCQ